MVRRWLLTYGVPFVGAVLLVVGIAGGVMGGYTLIQPAAGLCGDPQLSVASQQETQRLLEGHEPAGGPNLDRVPIEDLSPAERRAIRAGVEDPGETVAVRGPAPHQEDFEQGVLVVLDDELYYVTLATANRCTEINPLLLPLGIAAGLLGLVGVLTPPIYRRYVAFERRQGGE